MRNQRRHASHYRPCLLVLAAGALLALMLSLAGKPQSALAQALTCGLSQITSGSGHSGIDLSLSGDGSHIAFTATNNFTGGNPDFNREVFLYDVPTDTFTQLTSTTGGLTNQVSTNADASRVAFVSDRNLTGGNGDGNDEIFLYDRATGLKQVTHTIHNSITNDGRQQGPSISGDGNWIAFISSSNLSGTNLAHSFQYFLYDVAANSFAQITNGTGGSVVGSTSDQLSIMTAAESPSCPQLI